MKVPVIYATSMMAKDRPPTMLVRRERDLHRLSIFLTRTSKNLNVMVLHISGFSHVKCKLQVHGDYSSGTCIVESRTQVVMCWLLHYKVELASLELSVAYKILSST